MTRLQENILAGCPENKYLSFSLWNDRQVSVYQASTKMLIPHEELG